MLFWSNETVKAAVGCVNAKSPEFFKSWMMALEHHQANCIMLEGYYTDKEVVDLERKQDRLVTYWLLL